MPRPTVEPESPQTKVLFSERPPIGGPVSAVEELTAQSRTTVLSNGRRRLELTSVPTRFRDVGGAWRDIDLRPVPDAGGLLRPTAAPGAHRLATRTGGDGATLDSPAGPIKIRHPGAVDRAGIGLPGGTALRYPGGLGAGKDLLARLVVGGIDEAVVLTDRATATPGYAVELILPPGRLTARERNGRVEIVDGDDAVVAAVGGGVAFDSAPTPARTGAETPATVHLAGRTGARVTIDVRISPQWLADPVRVFPITIDPTYSISGYNFDGCPNFETSSAFYACDTYVNSDNPYAGTYSGQTQLRVGSPGFTSASPDDAGAPNRTRAFLKFPTDSFGTPPFQYPVSSATLEIFNYEGFPATGATDVYGQGGPVYTGTAWQNQPGGSDAASGRDGYGMVGSSTFFGGGAGYVPFDVTTLARRWFNGISPNHGIRLESPSEYDPSLFRKFYSGEGGFFCGQIGCDNKPPKLTIEYQTPPGPPTNAVATATAKGASVTWNPPANDGGAPITAYQAHLYRNGVYTTRYVEVCGTCERRAQFSLLDPNVPYQIDIYARNVVNYSIQTRANTVFPVLAPSDPELLGGTNPAEVAGSCVSAWGVNCTGGNYSHSTSDLVVPGRGPALAFGRTYNSQANYSGPLGPKWTHTYDLRLVPSAEEAPDKLVVHQENDAGAIFSPDGAGGYRADSNVLATLSPDGVDGYRFMRLHDLVSYRFTAGGLLTSITDRNGWATTLNYDGDRLMSVSDPAGRSLSFTYNAAGYLAEVTDPVGRRVSFGYDPQGRHTTFTDVANGTTTYAYSNDTDLFHLLRITDPRGHTVGNAFDGNAISVIDGAHTMGYSYGADGTATITDPRSNQVVARHNTSLLTSLTQGAGSAQAATWSFGRDSNNLALTEVLDPDGRRTTSTYDAKANRLSSTDGLGRRTTSVYNAQNRPVSVTDQAGVTTTLSYDANSNLTSVSTPLVGTGQVATTTYIYDTARPGDLVAVVDPNNDVTYFAYDSFGNRIVTWDPLLNATVDYYDGIGRRYASVSPKGVASGDYNAFATFYGYNNFSDLTYVVDPLSHVTFYGYDANRNLTTITDANNRTTTTTFNAYDQPVAVNRPDGAVTQSTYDGVGNLASQIDGLGRATTYTYDALDRTETVTDPNNRLTRYGYDRAGNLTQITDAAGGVTTRGYDNANQATTINYSDPATPDVSFGYDPKGRRSVMTDGTGISTYAYDSLDRLSAQANGAGSTMAYAYDLGGRLTSLTYPPLGANPAPLVTRGYDAAGRLTSVRDWLNNTTSFGYDPNANLVSAVYGNATMGAWTYDNADRLTRSTAANSAGTFMDLAYGRDDVGLLTSEGPIAYGYDPADRLVSASASPTASYGYDASDNLTSATVAGVPSTFAYDPAHRLTNQNTGGILGLLGQSYTFSYDAKGNRTARTDTALLFPSPPLSYSWDQANRLANHAGATHRYNGDGLRMRSEGVVTRGFTWDTSQGLPLLASDGSTAWVSGPAGLPLAQITATGIVHYYHQDQLGSTRTLTDAAGQVAATYTYDPYGNSATTTGIVTNPFRYAGEYRDESGLIYLRARYYDPATSQFLSRDPIEVSTGQPYAYADDSPLNGTDPSGLICVGTAQAGRAAPVLALEVFLTRASALKAGCESPPGTISSFGSLPSHPICERHHIIQDAAVRDVVGYKRRAAPAIVLIGPSYFPGSPHYNATQVQNHARNRGTYGRERVVANQALFVAGVSAILRNIALQKADEYFMGELGLSPNSQLRIPGSRLR